MTSMTAILLAGCLAAAGACGIEGPGDHLQFTDDGGGATVGGGGGLGFDPGSGSGGEGGGFDTCATASDEAKLVPINMFIAVDKSGSMDGNNKWNNAKSAFTTFFQEPEADSLNVALRFWPDAGCDGSNCGNIAACATPQVPLGSLKDPNHEQQLIAAFNAKSPNGGTPMSAALAGATQWCIDNQAGNMGAEVSVVLLLSDGEPTQCDESTAGLTAIASNAFNQAGVLVFAVGLQGSNEGLMNAIAQAGQTQKGYFIGNGNTKDELLLALKDIQKNAVACAFAMPEADDDDDVVDPTKINVTYTPSGSSDASPIVQVASEQDCTPQKGGWYYDDPLKPKVIKLCPSTCASVQADPGGKIEIVVGCTTIVD
jgi:hypothetical protein